MRVLVTGGRFYDDVFTVYQTLTASLPQPTTSNAAKSTRM